MKKLKKQPNPEWLKKKRERQAREKQHARIIRETRQQMMVGRALSSPAYHTWDHCGMPIPNLRPVQDPSEVLVAHRGPDGCVDRAGVRGCLTTQEWLAQE